jgi:predicted Fe-S protein YdhL (DUF1289 family)
MVRSPCTKICAINYNDGFCMGCKRTIEEITSWTNLSDVQKKKILLKTKNRKFFAHKVRKKISKPHIFK